VFDDSHVRVKQHAQRSAGLGAIRHNGVVPLDRGRSVCHAQILTKK
jgi:hypothetical protein